MAANSPASAQKDKLRTEITLSDAIDMIRSALWYYMKAGGKVRVGNSSQDIAAILVLAGCSACQNCKSVYLFENIVDGLCPQCQKK